MAVLDSNLRYVRCNTYLTRLLGIEADQLLGRRLDEAFDMSAQPSVLRSLERMRDGEVRLPQQVEYEFTGGDRPLVRERRAPLFDAQGRLGGLFLTVERLDRERFAETSLAALRQALDSAGEMVLEISRDGSIVDANETALAWLGYSREQLTGLRLGSIDASLTEERFGEMIDALLGRGAFHGEARYRTRLGSEFEVDLVLQRVEHAEREFIFLLVRDISDRKRIEQELAENAERLSTIFHESPVGILQLDASFRVRRANRAACALMGYSERDLLGRDPVRMLHADDIPASLKQRERFTEPLASGATLVSEPDRRLIDREGRTVWVKLGWRALGGVDASRGYLLVLENFTERKLYEDQLRIALREQQSLFETMSAGVAKVRDGHVVLANREFARMFGFSDAEVIEMPLRSLWAGRGDDVDAVEEPRSLPTVQPGRTSSTEVVLYDRHGHPIWCLVQARPVGERDFGAGADPGGDEAIFTFQDVTELRRQREAAARSASDLQALLVESRLIFDTALVGLLFVREGRLLRANAAMEDLLGCDPGTLVDQIQLFAHPSDRMLLASLEERFETIRRAGACEFELLLYRRRSDPIWVAVQGRAVNPERPELGYIFAFVDIDQRKRSERELRATLNELQRIFDNALVAILYVANDLVVKANATAERLFGFSATDLRELQFGSLFADPTSWRNEHADWIAEGPGGSTSFEHRMRRADGTLFWCAGSVRPIEDEVPERGMIVALMDIDARRRSEDELRSVRRQLDLVIENLPVLVSVRDVNSGRFLSLNRAGEAMTGLSRAQVIGRTWHEVYGRQFADLYREMDRRAIATGEQIERPRDVMLRADGRTLIVNQRVVPIFEDAGGKPDSVAYVMSIIDDRSDEVRAETALRETESRFRQFAENIDQLVFIANSNLTQLIYVNSRYGQLVGASSAELMEDPRKALAHVHPDDMPRLKHQLPRVIAGIRRLRGVELMLKVNHVAHGVRTVSVRLSPARMHDGAVRVFGVAEDVTERVAAEQQRLDDAVRQRDLLVREVHHRIKNNLQGVAGLLQHMASGKPEVANQLNEIAGQIQAIAQVHGLQIGAGAVELGTAGSRGGSAGAGDQRAGHQRDQVPRDARPRAGSADRGASRGTGDPHRECRPPAGRIRPGARRLGRLGPGTGQGAAAAPWRAPAHRAGRRPRARDAGPVHAGGPRRPRLKGTDAERGQRQGDRNPADPHPGGRRRSPGPGNGRRGTAAGRFRSAGGRQRRRRHPAGAQPPAAAGHPGHAHAGQVGHGRGPLPGVEHLDRIHVPVGVRRPGDHGRDRAPRGAGLPGQADRHPADRAGRQQGPGAARFRTGQRREAIRSHPRGQRRRRRP